LRAAGPQHHRFQARDLRPELIISHSRDNRLSPARISLSPQCYLTNGSITLSLNGTSYYETQTPPGGSFELQAVPGNYVLNATNGSNCVISQPVILSMNQVAQLALVLQLIGQSGSYYPGNNHPNYPTYPVNSAPSYSAYPPSSPYPCTWVSYGCGGNAYPGSGNGFGGKPNVYISGKSGTRVEVRVKLPTSANMLAAVPVHGTRG